MAEGDYTASVLIGKWQLYGLGTPLQKSPIIASKGPSENPEAEVTYLLETSEQDPQYWFITADGTWAILGPTGLVKSVYKLQPHEEKQRILHRDNAYGKFRIEGNGASVEEITDEIYEGIANLNFNYPAERKILDWNAQKVLARFEDNRRLYLRLDIIPEYNDTMSIVKISEGCPRNCPNCPNPLQGGLVIYDRERISENMRRSRELEIRYHEDCLDRMDEVFLITALTFYYFTLPGMP